MANGTRVSTVFPILALSLVAPRARGQETAESAMLAAQEALEEEFTGVGLIRGDEGERAIYGRPMTAAWTADKAVHLWLKSHAPALGAQPADLRVLDQRPIGTGDKQVFVLQQYIDGLPVEDAIGRLVVRRRGRSHVIYAAARVARRPATGFRPEQVSATAALAAVRGMPAYASLTDWSAVRKTIYVAAGDFLRNVPVRAWTFQGWTSDRDSFAAYTFFVEDSTGRLLEARDEVYRVDLPGQVRGNASPGLLPDTAANPPQSSALPQVEVRSALGPSTLSDADGEFTLPNGGTTAVQIEAELAGPWVVVRPASGDPLVFEQSVVPPGPVDCFFNAAPAEFATAQVNGFLHANLTRDFYKSRQPAFTGLDTPLDCLVNLPSTCNAFFTPAGLSINFFGAGSGCVNTAYSTVIAHEFGHFIVNRHNLPQGAFGEGYSDCIAMLQHDDHVVGRNFFGESTAVRDVVAANQQYPCFGEVHACGQVLGGVWWDIKTNLQSTLGPDEGLAYARQLLTDWTEITIGGRLLNSAHPLTAVEVLTVDDDDGDILDGTPNSAAICEAFAAHNIFCPGSCGGIRRVRLTCREGTFDLRATVASTLPRDTELTFLLDSAVSSTATVNRLGRASTTFTNVSEGTHEVCLQGCADVCSAVSCLP